MSECEKAAPSVTEPPRAGNAVRRAWMWLIAYALAGICFYIYFEWRNAIFGAEDEYLFFRGLALFFFAGASLYLLIKSLVSGCASLCGAVRDQSLLAADWHSAGSHRESLLFLRFSGDVSRRRPEAGLSCVPLL